MEKEILNSSTINENATTDKKIIPSKELIIISKTCPSNKYKFHIYDEMINFVERCREKIKASYFLSEEEICSLNEHTSDDLSSKYNLFQIGSKIMFSIENIYLGYYEAGSVGSYGPSGMIDMLTYPEESKISYEKEEELLVILVPTTQIHFNKIKFKFEKLRITWGGNNCYLYYSIDSYGKKEYEVTICRIKIMTLDIDDNIEVLIDIISSLLNYTKYRLI